MIKRQIVLPPEHLFPPDEWRIIEARWSPDYWARAETIFALSNGYLGTRGTYAEGRPAFAPGTYINGFHETWPISYAEEAFGMARVGQTIVNLPDAFALELFVDDEPLFLPTARLVEYSRVLDMREGTVRRDLVWATASGKHVRVSSCRVVSLEHRHLAAVVHEVTVDQAAPIAVRSRITSRVPTGVREPSPDHVDDPRLGRELDGDALELVVSDGEDGRFLLGFRTRHSGMTLGIAAAHVIETANERRVTARRADDEAEMTFAVEAEANVPFRIVKYLSFHTSRVAPPSDLVARCERTVDRAVQNGFESLIDAQRRNLDMFWQRADVVVDSTIEPVRVQQAIRWNLFQLAQASWRAEGTGIPAKGLTGGAYDGHYFWDTEVYIVSFLSYTQPRIARNLLRFRHSMLGHARERARQLGHRGATFPWRTINGQEASPHLQAGTAQYHLNADIAYAIRRYVDVRGDVGLLAEVGVEMLVETARMWESLGFYDDDSVFHLHGVTGPDEYTTVVNDNAFTNLMARLNLNFAATALQRLETERPEIHAALCFELQIDPAEPQAWQRAARAMYVPHDPERDITPQDDTFLSRERWDLDGTPPEAFPLLLHHHPLAIYRHQVLKQADVVMAMFLLGNEFTVEQKRRNFEYYDPLTTGDSSLSASIQSIVAAEIGDERAANRYFDFALLMDLADVAGNVSDGVHVASSAGVWMALVFGFGGVRDFDGELSIDPHLPRRWRSLTFPIRVRDRQLRVTVTHDEERYLLEEGEPLELNVRGEKRTLAMDDPLVLPRGSRG
jgi:alpha,alpha-trehalose phosphorylase